MKRMLIRCFHVNLHIASRFFKVF